MGNKLRTLESYEGDTDSIPGGLGSAKDLAYTSGTISQDAKEIENMLQAWSEGGIQSRAQEVSFISLLDKFKRDLRDMKELIDEIENVVRD